MDNLSQLKETNNCVSQESSSTNSMKLPSKSDKEKDERRISELEENFFNNNLNKKLQPALEELSKTILCLANESEKEKTLSNSLSVLAKSLKVQIDNCLMISNEQEEEHKQKFQELAQLYKKRENKLNDQLNRRLSALEETNEMKNTLILSNLQLKKKVSSLKKSLNDQKKESETVLLKSQKENLEIKKKRSWINHCNMSELNKSLETCTFSKPLSFVVNKECKVSWNFNDKIPFIQNLENSSAITTCMPTEFGGSDLAPGPIQYLVMSILAEFVRSFVILCSMDGLKLKEVYSELILQINLKKYLGINIDDILIPLVNIKLYVQSSEHPDEIRKCFEKTKQSCPMISYLASSSNFKLEYDYKTTNENNIRKEKGKGVLNGLKKNKIKRLKKKFQRKKTEEIEAFVAQGLWNLKNNNDEGQFKGSLSCEKNGKFICEMDWPIEIGGSGTKPDWFSVMATSLCSMSLSSFVLISTLQNIKLDHIGISLTGKWDRRRLYNLNNSSKSEQTAEHEIKMKYDIVSQEPDFIIEKLFTTIKKTSLCNQISQLHTQMGMAIQINDDISQDILIKSKKISLLQKKL
ncbi:hydroperoxide reductase [Anaeramoeba flamelloides]|uniref:Hydroperoxide reductase n=1 Tax=Anaeramoeba flamelloides TaxID=1746091 RepID=A0AAV7YNM3_9EUKA|nr:hydroperoxide reductase [Anaeramoeba flamelloides]